MKGKIKVLIILFIFGFFAYSFFSAFWFRITLPILVIIAILTLITKVVTDEDQVGVSSRANSCVLGNHSWVKLGGPHNIGNGNFEQTLKCIKCNKRKNHRS